MPVTRFAPSPTGYLHIGHALSALYARAQAGPDGRFLVRLEDIDRTRCRPEYAAAIDQDLRWLGLDWPRPVRVQSEHFADYAQVLDGLRTRGLVYPCFCTRSAARVEAAAAAGAPHGPGPLYPGTCRHLSAAERADRIAAGTAHAWRLDLTRARAETGPLTWRDLDRGTMTAAPELLGDVVLARKDCPTSYHLSVTWDDALQGVELVTRGEDLFEATHIHRLLQALLDLPVPAWRHHRLLLDAAGKRFAKRDKAPTLSAMREAGKTA
ncbi:MAG: tRNA glutamyl-Q synthetase, partial [Rhodospirillales bacterium]|nr:tRNA glutamyl-Q synthetase [Rhodospirillales bacterium]